jgi:hypothetical protein
MKKIVILSLIWAVNFICCNKNNEISNKASDLVLIKQARFFFDESKIKNSTNLLNDSENNQSPRILVKREVLWENAYVLHENNSSIIIAPIKYYNNFYIQSNFGGTTLYAINDIVDLVIFPDKGGQLHSEMLSFFPDSNYKINKPFTGIVFIDEWNGSPKAKFRFERDGIIKKWNGGLSIPEQTQVQSEATQEEATGIIETCYTISGYNYSTDDPSDAYYWSEPGGCIFNTDENFASDQSVVGATGANLGTIAGNRGINPAQTIVITGGNNIIGNIVDYDKCFTSVNGNSNTYQVMICVSQPVPGTRQSWGVSLTGITASSSGDNPVNVGHVFLMFTESNGPNVIRRNIGFYPKTSVVPSSPSDIGQLNNDDQHNYNISLSIIVTSSAFFNMLDYVAQNDSDPYNLNTLNCTTFALRTLLAANITLPSTIGEWFQGSGNDPGDLGEDIRSMNLSSDMTRFTVSSNHPNLGTCF